MSVHDDPTKGDPLAAGGGLAAKDLAAKDLAAKDLAAKDLAVRVLEIVRLCEERSGPDRERLIEALEAQEQVAAFVDELFNRRGHDFVTCEDTQRIFSLLKASFETACALIACEGSSLEEEEWMWVHQQLFELEEDLAGAARSRAQDEAYWRAEEAMA